MKQLFTLLFLTATLLAKAQYTTLPSGLRYRTIKKGTGKTLGKLNDFIICKIKGTVSGTTIFDSKQVNKGQDQPINFKLLKPQFKGDVMEGLMLMREGDSTEFRVAQDSFYRGPQKPPFVKKGDDVIYTVKCIGIRTEKQIKDEQIAYKKQMAEMEKFQKQMKRQQDSLAKAQKFAKILMGKEDATIKTYLATNGITNATKTPSGLYIAIDEEGNGDLPKTGDNVKMNYTGSFLDGKKFDSNVDSAFNHVQPFSFPIGQRRVIAGWDEGVAKLKKGAKAKFLIPSNLAYGPSGQNNIPANSILRFDLELVDIEKQLSPAERLAIDEKIMQNYITQNNISNATKTASGMYIVVTEAGTGDKPAVGDQVTMNYTGTLSDGSKFDSNVDSAFNHVQPFNFALGKGQVIKGWDEGIATLKKGSKATLIIPSGMAYGQQERPKIPANSPLIFNVELVDFTKATTEKK